eukprot:scaffold81328_cov16-Tisochrysis_lutea.AAC.1
MKGSKIPTSFLILTSLAGQVMQTPILQSWGNSNPAAQQSHKCQQSLDLMMEAGTCACCLQKS